MPLYRANGPLSYVKGNQVINIVNPGTVFTATEEQVDTIPSGLITYVGSGSSHYYAPRATFLMFDNLAQFPDEGNDSTIYLDKDAAQMYFWYDGAYIPTS